MRTVLLLTIAAGCAGEGDDALPTLLSDCRASDGDPLSVDALVHVAGTDDLNVTVSHGGGCEEHAYQLCWPDQSLLEESPPQAALEMFHDANGDGCEAELTEELTFDISALRDASGMDEGTIAVSLGGLSVDYTF